MFRTYLQNLIFGFRLFPLEVPCRNHHVDTESQFNTHIDLLCTTNRSFEGILPANGYKVEAAKETMTERLRNMNMNRIHQ